MSNPSSALAHRRPLLFSVLVTLSFVVALVVLSVAASSQGPAMQELVGALGRGAMAIGAGWYLLRLGWRRWLWWPGTGAAWRLSAIPLAYLLVVYPLLFTGRYGFHSSDYLLLSLVALNGFAAGVMEEVFFRGLVLESLVRLWGAARKGLWRALGVSSLLFSAPHALNVLAGAELLRTGAQLVWALLLGIVFGALVVAGRSLWPVAALHGIGNAVIHTNRHGAEAATEPTAAVLLALAPIPLLLYAWRVLPRDHLAPGRDRSRQQPAPLSSRRSRRGCGRRGRSLGPGP